MLDSDCNVSSSTPVSGLVDVAGWSPIFGATFCCFGGVSLEGSLASIARFFAGLCLGL